MEVLLHEKQIYEYEDTIRKFKEQNEGRNLLTNSELNQLEKKLERLKQKVYSQLTAWERVTICRHPSRPRSIDYTKNICEKFVELKGDRLFGDDHAVIGGLAVIGGVKFLVIGQEKGCDTESRMHRNFGMLHPEGFRKAMRLMRLAEKFKLPVVSLLDTPGAYAGLTAEERGQGWAIAENLRDMALLTTPIIVVVIGEGASGGALGMGVGDAISMLQHSYYSVITPEGCASIIWKDVSKKAIAAEALKLNAESLLQNGLIDEIIKEPLGGAHHNPAMVYQNVKNYILEQWNLLKEVPPNTLVEQRYMKFRKMGKFLVNGVANS